MSDHFNVFNARYETMENEYFEGSGAQGRILHQSADGQHLTIATRYPNGVRFSYGAQVDYMETFYVVHGHGTRTLPDGSVLDMNAGDVILVQPGIEIAYVYDPGLVDVAFFWSSQRLPDSLTGGLSPPEFAS